MRRLGAALAWALILTSAAAFAQPGRLIELAPMGAMSPGEVDALVGGPFRNDGETAPTASATVDTYLMRFEAAWPDGRAVEAVAQLNVPRLEAGEEAILFTFAPGSTGLVENCAPSRGFADAGAYETYGRYTLAYAGQGFVSMMPNYLGFFEVGVLQPYFVREAEGRLVLDATRAAFAALERLEVPYEVDDAFVGGYSQGGHAAFAAADLAAEYAPDLPLRGVLGFGPSGELATLFEDFGYVAPWVLYAWREHYGEAVDPSEVLLGGYAASLAEDAERMCILGVQRYYPSSPEALYQPDFVASLREGTLERTHPALAELFAENDAGLSGHGLPVMVLQGVDDPVVPLDDQHRHVAAMCDAGSPVRYPNYVRTRHETRYLGFEPAMDWMRGLATGGEPPSDCEAVRRP